MDRAGDVGLGPDVAGHMAAPSAEGAPSTQFGHAQRKQRLLVQMQRARQLESLAELTGDATHELNNLLAVIINYAGFVSEDLAGEAPVSDQRRCVMRADAEQITTAAQRAAQLIHRLQARIGEAGDT